MNEPRSVRHKDEGKFSDYKVPDIKIIFMIKTKGRWKGSKEIHEVR